MLSPTHGGTKATPVTNVRCGCGDFHELWTQRGAICERHILDTGKTTFTSSPVARRYSRRNTNGIFRWHIDIALACGIVHTERLDTTPDNRTEHLCQYVASDTDTCTAAAMAGERTLSLSTTSVNKPCTRAA